MITLRKSNERGEVKMDWLHAFHSFSFASYFDPRWMGFSKLRVINEDFIDGGQGFGTHPHRDMEIMTFIIDGALEHRDTMGNHAVIKPGDIQIMSAGTGIMHSEYNPDPQKQTHSIQIWIEPEQLGIKPRYEHYKFNQKHNDLTLIASATGGENIAKINQDAQIFHGDFDQVKKEIELSPDRQYWLQVFNGGGTINDLILEHGDALAIQEESQLNINESHNLKFLLFDLP
ncbi:MAG: quercetin 2,3-dioxygenase [Halobacteriovoraceae bacterium]|nr:quercetin 2,3-dioxygenase [Halobacteriovoraceae bacterium]|tara:strand:+ start:5824 stop:6513 length:690 start_codon:yes stop_codon:yes gene_type:complete